MAEKAGDLIDLNRRFGGGLEISGEETRVEED